MIFFESARDHDGDSEHQRALYVWILHSQVAPQSFSSLSEPWHPLVMSPHMVFAPPKSLHFPFVEVVGLDEEQRDFGRSRRKIAQF